MPASSNRFKRSSNSAHLSLNPTVVVGCGSHGRFPVKADTIIHDTHILLGFVAYTDIYAYKSVLHITRPASS